MIKFIDNYYTHSDDRGNLTGLLNQGTWEEINLISTKKDTIRGNHYHKTTIEAFIILDGEIEISIFTLDKKNTSIYTVKSGDVFLIQPMIVHTFHIKQDAKWLNLLSKKTDQKNPDIHRFNVE